MSKTRLLSLVAIGVIGYVAWAVMAWYDPAARPDFLKANAAAVMGVLALALHTAGGPPTPPTPAIAAG
jgi:hypothetical protein